MRTLPEIKPELKFPEILVQVLRRDVNVSAANAALHCAHTDSIVFV